MNNPSHTKPAGFEEVEHTADWAYRVWGQSLEELFTQAARGLYDLVGLQLTSAPRIVKCIHLQGVDRESLLVAWLNELLHLRESENLGFDQINSLQVDTTTLEARVTGSHVCQWLKDIKAVTYHNLAIRLIESGYETTLVLDV